MRKYEEIMERIKVSSEMRERILAGSEKELATPMQQLLPLRNRRRYVAAAGITIFLLGAIALPQLLKNWSSREPDLTQGSFVVTEVATKKELEKTVGFTMPDLEKTEQKAEEVAYYAYGKDVAEVIYQSADQKIVFRKSTGGEENSGDYTAYSAELTQTIAGQSVTLKGEAGFYRLAVWTDGEFSYSVRLEREVSAEELMVIVKKLAE